MLWDFWTQQWRFDGNDITANALLPKKKKISAQIISRSNGLFAGKEELIFWAKRENIDLTLSCSDGQSIRKNDVVATLSGNALQLMKSERLFLNVLSRLSGIATVTAAAQKKIPPEVLLLSTRKTLWGAIDKKGVVAGGGGTHRLSLAHAILVKENHLASLSGGVKAACALIKKYYARHEIPDSFFWEIEVENEKEFFDAVRYAPPFLGVIMLDNFSPAQISALSLVKHKSDLLFFEASGGITMETLSEFSQTGVDSISAGFLTNSVQPLDFSMRVE